MQERSDNGQKLSELQRSGLCGYWAERVDSRKVGVERILIINLKLQNEGTH